MIRAFKTILVTGGAGFIGSNFIRFLLEKADFAGRIVNLDALTYAGNPESLADLAEKYGGTRYFFERADICDREAVARVFEGYAPDALVHLAAESHVDRSILGPEAFIKTNVMGTFTLLEAARNAWKFREDVLFHHVSTCEVFGALGDSGSFTEESPYDPRSPYSASKAGSDHLVRAYHNTYGLVATLSNCSNNYGPYQFPEKLIPFMILNMVEGRSLPVYGDGKNVRDWIHVEDHAAAVWEIMKRGEAGRSYNIGGENEWENIRLLGRLVEIVAEESGQEVGGLRKLITYVKDRPGHDRRYAIDCSRIKRELGWERALSFDEGLRKTVRWYLDNALWCERVRSGEYRTWLDRNYASR
jgi:dTDP-glucose 4,6-dehydratase